jgi:hypothetical protein
VAEIKVRIAVPDVATVIVSYDQIQVHRSKTGKYGTYEEITTANPPVEATSRVLLDANKVTYCYYDACGDFDFFYKVRYFNSGTSATSAFSEPMQGDADSALDVLSVEDLTTNFLFGVDLTDDEGQPYPDSLFEFYIKSAVSYLEHVLDLPIRPTRYIEDHDFIYEEFRNNLAFFLDHYPVLDIESVTLQLPGTAPSAFDTSWFYVQKEFGHLNLIPGLGGSSIPLLGASAGFWPPFVAQYRTNRFIPNIFQIKYTAGFKGPCAGGRGVPDNIRMLVGLIASYGPLNIAGDLVAGAGLSSTSLSIDGLSQGITTTNSSTNAGYGARLIMYRKEMKEQIKAIRDYYKGARLRVA